MLRWHLSGSATTCQAFLGCRKGLTWRRPALSEACLIRGIASGEVATSWRSPERSATGEVVTSPAAVAKDRREARLLQAAPQPLRSWQLAERAKLRGGIRG